MILTDLDLNMPSAELLLTQSMIKSTNTHAKNVENQHPVSVLLAAKKIKNAVIRGLLTMNLSGNQLKLFAVV